MATNLSHPYLHTPFQGEFVVSFIAITLSFDTEISCMACFGQLENASRGWEVLRNWGLLSHYT